jgi:predicted PurR-regulated permease PerM
VTQPRASGWLGGPDGRDWVLRVLYLVAVLVLFGAYLYSVRVVLSPLVLFVLLLFLWTPLHGTRLYPTMLIASGGLLLLWLLRTTGFLLAPFVLALILAYVLDPVVDWIEARGPRRPWAVISLGLPVVAAVLVLLLVVAPLIGREFSQFVSGLPAGLDRVVAWLEGVRDRIVALGIPGIDPQSVPELRDFDAERIVEFVDQRREVIVQRIWKAVLGVGKGIGFLLSLFGYLVLTPVLTYYLLRDYDRLTGAIATLIPGDRRERWVEFARQYDRLLSRYLRGQLVVAICVGSLTFLLFWILRFPNAVLLGVIAGVFNVVPYLGLLVSLVPALIIAFASGSILVSLLKIAVVFGAVQAVEGMVLSPLVVGESVGLHPVWVILALSVFGFFFGFVGLLLAVPLAVLLKLVLSRALEAYRRSIYYGTPAAR